MRLKAKTFCFVLLIASFSAQAGQGCYGVKEAEAERVIRLHSELMVHAFTCRQDSGGQDLLASYRKFTARNGAALRGAEQTLIRYHENRRKGQGTARLDALRTRLANEYGQKIARQTPAAYCAAHGDEKTTLYDSSSSGLSGLAQSLYAGFSLDAPICAQRQEKQAKDRLASREGK